MIILPLGELTVCTNCLGFIPMTLQVTVPHINFNPVTFHSSFSFNRGVVLDWNIFFGSVSALAAVSLVRLLNCARWYRIECSFWTGTHFGSCLVENIRKESFTHLSWNLSHPILFHAQWGLVENRSDLLTWSRLVWRDLAKSREAFTAKIPTGTNFWLRRNNPTRCRQRWPRTFCGCGHEASSETQLSLLDAIQAAYAAWMASVECWICMVDCWVLDMPRQGWCFSTHATCVVVFFSGSVQHLSCCRFLSGQRLEHSLCTGTIFEAHSAWSADCPMDVV